MRPPGLSYVRSVNSSQDPGSVLWPIEGTNEGVLEFRLSHLPDSSYLPETIQFNFPIEILTFSPPSLDKTGPKLLKFSHNRGRLSFTNPPGEPPTQNPPLNETRIRTHLITHPEINLIIHSSFRNEEINMKTSIRLHRLPISYQEVFQDKLGLMMP